MRYLITFFFLFLLGFISAEVPTLVAHRGASADAPENTIAAFKLAWSQGADIIEGDFRLTKDQEIVCIHDSSTKRVAGKKLVVASSTLAQLRQLEVGSWKSKKWQGEKIPTLQEVLEIIPEGKQLFLEVKSNLKIVDPLVKALVDSNVDLKKVSIIAFNSDIIAAMKKYLPTMKAHWLVAFRVNESGERIRSDSEIFKILREINADGIDCYAHGTIDKNFAQSLKREGFEFHVWTVNDVKVARYVRSLGVDSITTDKPRWLREQLEEKSIVGDRVLLEK